jgi:Big-like domain-containing protein/PKD domain-containing protein
MIAPARTLPRRPVLSRLASGALALAGLGIVGLTAGCDKVPLTAPTGATVTLFSNTTIVPVNGAAEITATVVEAGGTLVQNGTLVTFTTTIGQIDPAEARTRDGKATVRLVAGTRSGRAIVRAFSGGITSGDLTVDIGGAAAGRISLTANPTVVPASGGTSQLLAVVFDVDGNRLPGVPVSFTTTAGSILSTVVVTNASGEAATSITTNRDADVTASAGGASGGSGGSGGGGGDGNGGGGGGTASAAVTATVKITAAAAPTVSISTSGTPSADTPTTFSITATPVAPAAIRTITVDFGDGSPPQTIGNTTSVAHTYRSSGTFTVTATAEDTNGSRGTGSTIIVVQPSAPILVTLTATPSTATAGQIITFRADLTQNPNNVLVDSVTWDFGDGNVRPGTGLTTTHTYSAANAYLARVTIRFVNGRTSFGETAVRIN